MQRFIAPGRGPGTLQLPRPSSIDRAEPGSQTSGWRFGDYVSNFADQISADYKNLILGEVICKGTSTLDSTHGGTIVLHMLAGAHTAVGIRSADMRARARIYAVCEWAHRAQNRASFQTSRGWSPPYTYQRNATQVCAARGCLDTLRGGVNVAKPRQQHHDLAVNGYHARRSAQAKAGPARADGGKSRT